jgi:thiol-disulfide isomerase/thioredoxin
MKKFLIIAAIIISGSRISAQKVSTVNAAELQSYIQSANHPLVVDFWATFCAPCLAELPSFQDLAGKYKDRHLELVLVSLDLPGDHISKIDSFVKKNRISVPVKWLNETDADYFCPKIDKSWTGGIPATLFVNNKKGYRAFEERSLSAREFEEQLKRITGD